MNRAIPLKAQWPVGTGPADLVQIDALLERVFSAAQERSLRVGVAGGAVRRAIRGFPATQTGQGCDIDLALPTERELTRRKFCAEDSLVERARRRRRTGWLLPRQATLFEQLHRLLPPQAVLDPIGTLDAKLRFQPANSYPTSEPWSVQFLTSDGLLAAPEAGMAEELRRGVLQMLPGIWTTCQPLRLLRFETDQPGMRIERETGRAIRDFSRRLFQDSTFLLRLTTENAMEASSAVRRIAAAPLLRVQWILNALRTGALSFSETEQILGPDESAPILRRVLDNPHHQIGKNVTKLLRHTRDLERVQSRLREWGWEAPLARLGYETSSSILRTCPDSRFKSHRRVKTRTATVVASREA